MMTLTASVVLAMRAGAPRRQEASGGVEGGDVEMVGAIRPRPGELLLGMEGQRWPPQRQLVEHGLGGGIGEVPLQVQMMRRISPGPADPLPPRSVDPPHRLRLR